VQVNYTHPTYDETLPAWMRARDVFAGEDAVKAAGPRYLPRLDSQTDQEYAAYRNRASFFNATARTVEGFVGLIFRRPPIVKLPEDGAGVGRALKNFRNDVDMLGTSLPGYAKNVVDEIMAVGRAGTLVDWEGDVEQRAYAVFYRAEEIINWRIERVNGRNVPTLVVLREYTSGEGENEFETKLVEQIRVLKLVESRESSVEGKGRKYGYQVEIWRQKQKSGRRSSSVPPRKTEWEIVETRVPLRLGKPLPLIPFVFHGPRHSLPAIEKLPLADIITVNLDHFRLDADFKHGLHFTALPTAWVSGFDKASELRIGSSTAWVAEMPGATAGFLEFTGQGLTTFERAMDRDERLMAVLGTRLLEAQKRVGETAQAIEMRQSGENSILGTIAMSASESLTQILRWAYWWNSTEETPEGVEPSQVSLELNMDFSTKGMSSQELESVVAAWQAGAISRETMLELFRKGEVLPEGRTNAEEERLVKGEAGNGQNGEAGRIAAGDGTHGTNVTDEK
jgi:hypothetical protein